MSSGTVGSFINMPSFSCLKESGVLEMNCIAFFTFLPSEVYKVHHPANLVYG